MSSPQDTPRRLEGLANRVEQSSGKSLVTKADAVFLRDLKEEWEKGQVVVLRAAWDAATGHAFPDIELEHPSAGLESGEGGLREKLLFELRFGTEPYTLAHIEAAFDRAAKDSSTGGGEEAQRIIGEAEAFAARPRCRQCEAELGEEHGGGCPIASGPVQEVDCSTPEPDPSSFPGEETR